MAKSKPENMHGVIFDSDEELGPVVDSDNSLFYLLFYKNEEYFSVYENEITFYKGVESLVRKHPFYSKYIKYLIDVVGIKTCQVLSNIEVNENAKKQRVTIEMHHGPILTLFDIVQIICNWLRENDDEFITTFKVAKIIMEEHRLNEVRTVLVSKSVHQQIHEGNVHLNYNQGFGDTQTFLEKYADGVSPEIRAKINNYIEWSMENDSTDNDVFKLAETMKQWGNNDFDTLLNQGDIEDEDDIFSLAYKEFERDNVA